jgi:hypothetical protein
MWASRAGLSEAELADLLGDGEPLGHAIWSPLRLAAGGMLVNRAGLLGIGEPQLRDAVKKRYLPRAQDEDAARLRLADYFESRENGTRKTLELPWQLFCLGAWERLTALLTEPSFLTAAWEDDPRAVRRVWRQIEALSSTNRWQAYAARIGDWPTNHPTAARIAVELFSTWKRQPPELESAVAQAIEALNVALPPTRTEAADKALDDALEALPSQGEVDPLDAEAAAIDDRVELRCEPIVAPPEPFAVDWTPVASRDEQQQVPRFTPDEIGQWRERVCDLENEGQLEPALALCQCLTGALRQADDLKRLRTHLIIEARLHAKLNRKEDARRIAREIIHLTIEHDPQNFDLFQGLIQVLGLTGS